MSYILEALKKAQAERQLGSTPGIHDAPVLAPAAQIAPDRSRLWLALGGALLLAVAGTAVVRTVTSRDAPPAGQGIYPVAPPPAPSLPVPAQLPAVARMESPAPRPVEVPAVTAVKTADAPPRQEPPVPVPAPAVVPVPAAQAPVSPAVQPSEPDDALPLLAELPQAVRSGVPQVTLGGYIYSPVPSERLLLVDKNLRHEGEEVGPGLVLERLLPRAAVMNYRGTRFRMPY